MMDYTTQFNSKDKLKECPKVKIRSSVGAEGLIDKNVIKFPDKEAIREVSSVREKMAFTRRNVRSCKR
jgi:hypothetical protein